MRDEPTISRTRGAVGESVLHDSAAKHLTGQALYTDDLPELPGTLHAFVFRSTRAHARLRRLNVAKARQAAGVRAVLTAGDIPGQNEIGVALPGDPLLAPGEVGHVGQAVVAIAADSLEQARFAARLIEVDYEDLPAILSVEDALAQGSFIGPSWALGVGDSRSALDEAPHRLQGEFRMGGQEHFYLEGQVAYAVPGEEGDLLVCCSTQHPSQTQSQIARVLAKPDALVTIEVRRVGGAFGGKRTQAGPTACIASLLAAATGRPVKYRMERNEDMAATGKGHDFVVRYDAGFDDMGRLRGLVLDLAARCGMSPDLSNSVVDRAVLHADNAYHLLNATVVGHRCRTHTVSNTAFRGSGAPQGMLAIEYVLDDIARALGKDALDIRWINLYGRADRNRTHYHQRVEDNILPEVLDRLETSSEYRRRRKAVDDFNAAHAVLKRGLALIPVKFGIAFAELPLNQASALVNVFPDGSIQLNHGGTEMGQGSAIKVAQLVAGELGVDLRRIRLMPTNTARVPNAGPAGANSGTDLNGAAAIGAARVIRNRMTEFLADHFGALPEQVRFADDRVHVGARLLDFAQACRLAHSNRVHLSAAAHYKTPKIWWDRPKGRGRPFHYFAYGAAATEAVIDSATGEYRFLRADILHDCGSSINPAIDRGQIEGGYVQGLGWLTCEELSWDGRGRLLTHSPSTYKIPAVRDVPLDLRVHLVANRPNREDVVHRSKAVGEPPIAFGISAFLALKDAVAAVGHHRFPVSLDAPATPERVLMACEDQRRRQAAGAAARGSDQDLPLFAEGAGI